MKEKVCLECGKLFKSYQKRCSRDCFKSFWIREVKPKYEDKRKFAAANSAKKRRTGKNVKCDLCGKLFYKQKNRLERKTLNNFCSFKCMGLFRTGKSLSDIHKQRIKENNVKYWLGKKRDESTSQKLREAAIIGRKLGKNKDTNIEKLIENQLLFNNILYVKQHFIEGFFVDFWLPEDNVVIECDGNYWHNYPFGLEKDFKRTKILEDNSYTVYRFWGSDILKDAKKCIESVSLLYA